MASASAEVPVGETVTSPVTVASWLWTCEGRLVYQAGYWLLAIPWTSEERAAESVAMLWRKPLGTAETKAEAAEAGMPAAEANWEGKLEAVIALRASVLEALV